MNIEYLDLILINSELKKHNTRFHVSYKNETTGCIEPPGSCCLTEDNQKTALECIRKFYEAKHCTVHISEDGLYFTCQESPSPNASAHKNIL